MPDLSEAEIDIKLRQSTRLEQKRSEIERLSQLVYGDAAPTSATVEGIDGAMAGSVAGQDIRTGRLGPLAGEGRRFLRAESPERQTAKAHLPQLAGAMEDYRRAVDFEWHQIETRHHEENLAWAHSPESILPPYNSVQSLSDCISRRVAILRGGK